MKTIMAWGIEAHDGRRVRMLPEGPFLSEEIARQFAEAEVGIPWVVKFLLFAEGDYVIVRSELGNQYCNHETGEVWTGRKVRMLEGFRF